MIPVKKRYHIIFAIILGIITFSYTIGYIIEYSPQQMIGENAPDLADLGDDWINARPASDGKVVLIHFWTYGCINSRRSLPKTQRIWEKYKGEDFMLIGIHGPDFGYDKDIAEDVRKSHLTYPVINDPLLGNWQRYGGKYWPRAVLIGKDQKIKMNIVGELGYDRIDERIAKELG